MDKENEKQKKFYWHANTSSGGTLSLSIGFEGNPSKEQQTKALAGAIKQCQENMERNGFIPYSAQLMSSRDISEKFGKTRQYWEKLLNEGKILCKETSAGRITTDLWVQGYLGKPEEVNKYVKNVKAVLKTINEREDKGKTWGKIDCPLCGQETFSFAVNCGGNTNGICRNSPCGFHVHTIN
jgi:hypothetical protein